MRKLYLIYPLLFLIYWGCEDEQESPILPRSCGLPNFGAYCLLSICEYRLGIWWKWTSIWFSPNVVIPWLIASRIVSGSTVLDAAIKVTSFESLPAREEAACMFSWMAVILVLRSLIVRSFPCYEIGWIRLRHYQLLVRCVQLLCIWNPLGFWKYYGIRTC